MKGGYRGLIVGCVLAVIAGLLIYLHWLRKSEQPKAAASNQSTLQRPVSAQSPSASPGTSMSARLAFTPPTEAEIKQQQERQWSLLFMTPISIYGKVVDENANPISGASVDIGVNDNPLPNKTGSTYIKITDEGGLFSLTGVHGVGFSVSASKSGYYSSERSMGNRNVAVPSKDDLPQPTKEQPIILVLLKQGQSERLIFTSSRQIEVPRMGRPINIDPTTGETGEGGLEVTSWIGNTSQRPFDWRYQLSVPGGGLVERKGQFDFEAPSGGYKPTTEINMPATAEDWSSRAEKQYFAKFADGRYARFLIRFYPSPQRNFVVLESYVNPTAGSRNLEFDPTKQGKVR